MYGKKRIVLQKNGLIILTGGKSHIHIGRYTNDGKYCLAWCLKPESKFENTSTTHNSLNWDLVTKKELREQIGTIYKLNI